ncbi:MAG: Dna2/Cas4 domain-containing protein, partial [Candidatus Kapaibacteriota bacterium]
YRLKQMGIIAKGELLIPKEKKKILVELTEELENELLESQKNIFKIIDQEKPPEVKRIIYCSKCGYRELCWS